MNSRRCFLGLASLGLLSSGARTLWSDDGIGSWPGWRGPNRDGMVENSRWPQKIGEQNLVKKWSVGLDAGYGGPIVVNQLVIVNETRAKKEEVVMAFDRSSGSKVWEARWEGSLSVPFFAKANGDWIRSTPASDGERVFVGGMRDVLMCFELESGKELWKKDFVAEYDTPLPDFGFVCSPLIDGNTLYVQAAGGLVKLETETGKVIWRSLVDGGGMNGSAFSSPVLTELHGRRMLVVQTRTNLIGVDPETGEKIWDKTVEAFRGMNILTPTIWKDKVFTSSYGGKSWLFDFEPSQNSSWAVRTQWENKAQGYMSSPIVIGSHLYLHLRNQRFVCLHLETGKAEWTTRPYGNYWRRVSNGQQILALDERGILLLIDADPTEFKLVDERKVSEEESWAHLAVVDQQVFVRDLKNLTVYDWS